PAKIVAGPVRGHFLSDPPSRTNEKRSSFPGRLRLIRSYNWDPNFLGLPTTKSSRKHLCAMKFDRQSRVTGGIHAGQMCEPHLLDSIDLFAGRQSFHG